MKKNRFKFFLKIILPVVLFISCIPCVYAKANYPQRIISLGPAITEELYLLGVEDRIVGVSQYCIRPPEAGKKEKVGTVVDVNVEKIIVLKPDLVIATALTDPRAVAKMKNLGLKVITIADAEDFTMLCRQFLEIGKLVGKRELAEEIVNLAKEKVNNIKQKAAGLPKPRVFLQVGAKPLVTVSKGSFINNLVELSGGINIVNSQKTLSYMTYSREKVLAIDPDYIIIMSMGSSGNAEKNEWLAFKNLIAVKNNNIRTINADDICSLTPNSFVKALKTVAGILHPDISWE